MPLSGEAIRMMNYADDIGTTLRRLLVVLPSLPVAATGKPCRRSLADIAVRVAAGQPGSYAREVSANEIS